MYRFVLSVITAAVCVLSFSCSTKKAGEAVYRLGEKAKAGPLIYRASGTQWHEKLGEGADARVPGERFLLVRVSVTNSGIATAPIPTMELVGPAGRTFAELADGRGVDEWMGTIRMVEPAQTEHGVVAFDVPPGDYRLRVRDQGEPDRQASVLIEIPYQPAAAAKSEAGN